MTMKFAEITFGSDVYELAWAMRDAVLRRPLGLALHSSEREAESSQRHFGLFTTSGELVACVSIVPLSDSIVKLRQMAVSPACQQQGLGRLLITEVEHWLMTQRINRIEMHARESAIGFYQKLGYAVAGDPFPEVTIAHVSMSKVLTDQPSMPAPSV